MALSGKKKVGGIVTSCCSYGDSAHPSTLASFCLTLLHIQRVFMARPPGTDPCQEPGIHTHIDAENDQSVELRLCYTLPGFIYRYGINPPGT